MTNLKSNRLIVYGIKYLPLVCTVLMTVHIGLLLFGVYEPITVSLTCLLMALLLVLLSVKFGFCILHKLMLLYMSVAFVCICLQNLDMFGCMLKFARIIMFIAGVVLIIFALKKKETDECD